MLWLLFMASSKADALWTEVYAFELGDHSVLAEEWEGRGGKGRYYDILRVIKFQCESLSFDHFATCRMFSRCWNSAQHKQGLRRRPYSKAYSPSRDSASKLFSTVYQIITTTIKSLTNTHADYQSLCPSMHHCPLVAPKPVPPHQFSTLNLPHWHQGQSPLHGEFTHANDHGCNGGSEIGCHLHVQDGNECTTTSTVSTTMVMAMMTAMERGVKRCQWWIKAMVECRAWKWWKEGVLGSVRPDLQARVNNGCIVFIQSPLSLVMNGVRTNVLA